MGARTIIAFTAALGWSAGAAAQAPMRSLVPCDQLSLGLESVSVGADRGGVRTYYDGQVTLMALDLVEPACCSFGLAIVMPAPPHGDEPVGMTCWTKWGYASVDVAGTQSRYDPATGLTLAIPTLDYDPETGATSTGPTIRLRIDAGRGTIVDLDAQTR